jgi:hypothetical protein
VVSERGGGALSFEAGARERRVAELLYDESARMHGSIALLARGAERAPSRSKPKSH